MSRQSCIYIDASAGTVARFRSRTMPEPLTKELLDFLIAGLGMTPSKVLAHPIDSCLEQVQRRAERVGDGRSVGWHSEISVADGVPQ